jgi:hypothetical protein
MGDSHLFEVGQSFKQLPRYFNSLRFGIILPSFPLIKKRAILTKFHDNVNELIRSETIVEFDKIFAGSGFHFFREFSHDIDFVQNDFLHFLFVLLHHFDVNDFDCNPNVVDRVVSFEYFSERAFSQTTVRVVLIDSVCALFQVHDFACLHIFVKISGKNL